MDQGAYREASPPAPQVFPLRVTAGAQMALVGALASLAVGLFVFLVSRGGIVGLFLFGAPGLFYFLIGAPRSLEVHHDRVVLRYWLGRRKTLDASSLIVQRLPDELVLIDGSGTYTVPAEVFPGSLDACAEALRAVASRFVVREEQR